MKKTCFCYLLITLSFLIVACQTATREVNPSVEPSLPPQTVVLENQQPTPTTTVENIPTPTPKSTSTTIPTSTTINQPTETATATAIDTLTPTATPSAIPEFQVKLNSVNVRSGPGINYAAIDTLIKNDIVVVIAATDDRLWYNVVYEDNKYGWISADVIEPDDGINILSILIAETIPAPPLPTATVTSTPTSQFSDTGTVTIINQTEDHPFGLNFQTCCEHFSLGALPGETVSITLPSDEYKISALSEGCRRELPNIRLGTEVLELTVFVVDGEGGCGFGIIINGEYFKPNPG